MTREDEQPPDGVERTRLAPVLTRAAATLAAAGVPSARVDAELLAAHVLGIGRGRLALVDTIRGADLRRLDELVAGRAARVPLQHLVGTAHFRHLELAVGPGVFVPRPETELLAGWAVAAAATVSARSELASPAVANEDVAVSARSELASPAVANEDLTVVDLCSGTGAVALAVAQEVPGVRVVAVERSPAALVWLRRNVAGTGLPVEVVAGDVTDPHLLAGLRGRVDLVLCNPPYVPAGTAVPVEVADHDPAEAVFGGPDGLAVIRAVVPLAAALLRPGGGLAIEHDDVHADAVPALLRADGRFAAVEEHQDLAGRPRFATARRTG